jgi:hypothetical protein
MAKIGSINFISIHMHLISSSSVGLILLIQLPDHLWHHASHHHTHQAHWEIAFEVKRADVLDMKIITYLF